VPTVVDTLFEEIRASDSSARDDEPSIGEVRP